MSESSPLPTPVAFLVASLEQREEENKRVKRVNKDASSAGCMRRWVAGMRPDTDSKSHPSRAPPSTRPAFSIVFISPMGKVAEIRGEVGSRVPPHRAACVSSHLGLGHCTGVSHRTQRRGPNAWVREDQNRLEPSPKCEVGTAIITGTGRAHHLGV